MKAISKSSVYAGDVWITKTIPKYTLSESQFSIDSLNSRNKNNKKPVLLLTTIS